MKFFPLAALALGATASVQERDVTTFQTTFTSLTGDVANLDIAINGIAVQLKTIADNFRAGVHTLASQPNLTQDESFAITHSYFALRDQLSNTTDLLVSAKGNIQASPNCNGVTDEAVGAWVVGSLFFVEVSEKVIPSLQKLFAAFGQATMDKFLKGFQSITCPK